MSWISPKVSYEKRAVAYYRHSAQDRQENSIEIQQDQVHAFAEEHSIEIIHEFEDRGISGLSTEGRDGFNEMIGDYVTEGKEDFDYVLVLDVSRFGRFQDTDLSAFYQGLCVKNNKKVIYTSIGFPNDDGLLHGLHLSIERYRASYYSKELSQKVWKGQEKLTTQGYWGGGMPPYGMKRLLLDEQRNPVQVLEHGEHKAIHNQRVTLTPGDKEEVAVIIRIFKQFAELRKTPRSIANNLNSDSIQSPGGQQWSNTAVIQILRNEIYKGWNVWNKTSQKLKTASHHNPSSEWVRTPDAFEAIVEPDLFDTANTIISEQEETRLRKYSKEGMLENLQHIYDEFGIISVNLINADENSPSAATYCKRFLSIDEAFQAGHQNITEEQRRLIIESLSGSDVNIHIHEDLIIVDNYFSILLQPVLPIPVGYEAYWTFFPHRRKDVDLTIGIPLSSITNTEPLGFLAFPRLMFQKKIRIRSTMDVDFGFYTYKLLDLIKQIGRQ